jgi:hypothetical protein
LMFYREFRSGTLKGGSLDKLSAQYSRRGGAKVLAGLLNQLSEPTGHVVVARTS